MKKIFILVANINNYITKEIYEIIQISNKISDEIQGEVIAVVIGYNLEEFVNELSKLPLDEVIVSDNEIFKYYEYSSYLQQIYKILIREPDITLVVCMDDIIGRELAGGLSIDLKSNAVISAFDIKLFDDTMQYKKYLFSNNYVVEGICNNKPYMITMYPQYRNRFCNLFSKKPKIKNSEIYINRNPCIIKNFSEEKKNKCPDIGNASIIVAFGNGITNTKNSSEITANGEEILLIRRFSTLLKGVMGGSRTVVDNGLIDSIYQIGLSGKIVAPDLYIACGISGSIQHIVGMINSKIILSINVDKNAPIFLYSHYGIVGDMFEILPEIIRALEKCIINGIELKENKV